MRVRQKRACFGMLSIRSGVNELTAGLDHYTAGIRVGPLVSGYHAGEWFAWNWWRLLWEPRTSAPDWWRAHNMASIGEGYSWPNLTIYSDGVRTFLFSRPSVRADAKPFRYLGSPPVILPSSQFQSALDAFIGRLIGRLSASGLSNTNLERVWSDVLAERSDKELARRRKLEALSGLDADSGGEEPIERLVSDSRVLGESAVEELAAEQAQSGHTFAASFLENLAGSAGALASPRDAVRLDDKAGFASRPETPAWVLGSLAARHLREQERLGAGRITDALLARLAGVDRDALRKAVDAAISFSLDKSPIEGRVVLRSRYKTGRRFEVARLFADRLVAGGSDKLRAVTRAYTYRQKSSGRSRPSS